MYERFTDRARLVMRLANQEAQRSCQRRLGTEHVLLGLLKEGNGVAAHALEALGIDVSRLQAEVERLSRRDGDRVIVGALPYSPRATTVVELAMQESRSLGHDYVGTEHLLLGLLRLQESLAGQALSDLGLTAESLRAQVLGALGQADSGPGPAIFAAPRIAPRPALPRRLGQAWRQFWGN